jgi:hypothetical protein
MGAERQIGFWGMLQRMQFLSLFRAVWTSLTIGFGYASVREALFPDLEKPCAPVHTTPATDREWVPYTFESKHVPFVFQISDVPLFSVKVPLQVCNLDFSRQPPPVSVRTPPELPLPSNCAGFLIRSLLIETKQPTLSRTSKFLSYVPIQYPRYYADLTEPFGEYKKKFSPKTLSTIRRKVRRFTDHCGGEIRWKVYKSFSDMREFHRLARSVSEQTYQERLMGKGLPNDEKFVQLAEGLAEQERVRGYILFDGERPVAYLFFPIRDGVLLYQYLGYDREYASWSVGTILMWIVLEDIFEDPRFHMLDFTEGGYSGFVRNEIPPLEDQKSPPGESDQKRQFATHSVACANVYFLRRSLRNELLVQAHRFTNYLSKSSGTLLKVFGLKAKIRRIIRFGIRSIAGGDARS